MKKLVNTIVPELVVVTLLLEQLLMAAMLHNLAIVNDVDLVNILDGGQPVGNGDGGAADLGSIQGILHYLKQEKLSSVLFRHLYLYLFTLCVQGRSGLIKKQNLGVPDQGPGYGHPLLLST